MSEQLELFEDELRNPNHYCEGFEIQPIEFIMKMNLTLLKETL